MREIKFRAWDEQRMLSDREVMEIAEGYRSINDAPNAMQFTGLKDKNGKEVYEGDLVKNVVTGVTYKIEWNEQCAGYWYAKLDRQDMSRFWVHLSDSVCYQFEVIGNKFENPELLA